MMSCTTNGCTLPIGQDINLSLDMAVTGNVANGSIVRSCGESCDTCTPSGTSNLRLTRTR
jgi:hypothetical protein